MIRPKVIREGDDELMLFEDVSWNFYEAVLNEYDEQPSRIAYADGRMEVPMTLSVEHEGYKDFFGDLVSRIAEVFEIPICKRGSSTLKQLSIRQGLEADLCVWVNRASEIRQVKRLDLAVHPPPDLVVEIDITHSVIDRESIYAQLGVAEMWSFSAKSRLTGWHLGSDGTWQRISNSVLFPMIRFDDLNTFLDRFDAGEEETALIMSFRQQLMRLRETNA